MPSEPAVPLDPRPPVAVSGVPTQFMNLPEELIVRIFELVFDDLLDERVLAQYECDPFPSRLVFRYRRPSPRQVPRQQIQISSSVYNTLKHTWDGYLALQASEGRALDERFSALSSRTNFLDLAEDELCDAFRMYGEVNPDLMAWRSGRKSPSFDFLTTFSRIVTLRASFYGGIPRSFTDALQHLPHLSDLTLQFHGGMGDACFTFGESTLALHRLTLTAQVTEDEDLRQLLTNLPSTLEELHFYYTFPAGLPIPWYSVPRLHLYPPRGYFRDPSCVIDDLEKVFSPENPRAVVVEELTIQVTTISLKMREKRNAYYEQVIPTLLKLMQRTTSMKHLRFFNFTELDWWQNNIRIPSVECVTLYQSLSGANYSPTDELITLKPFLRMFPSLRKLIIAGFRLLTESVAPTLTQPNTFPAFVSLHPRLAFLLTNLQISRVVEVRYRPTIKSDRELRIRRDEVVAEWDGEWWNV